MTELWETDHPYYAMEGNFYKRDHHHLIDSWADFAEDMGSSDADLNLLYRWDWQVPNPDDYESPDEVPNESLLLFFILQRKAICMSFQVAVVRSDADSVRAWLVERAQTMAAIWAPIQLAAIASEEDS